MNGWGRRCVRRVGCAVTAAVFVTAGLSGVGGAHAAPSAAASASELADVSPESRAAAAAAESGERVEVTAARTEESQVFANPDGTFTQETSAAPVRARQDDGSWAAIDTTLVRAGDGSVRAKSTTARVEFSSGGDQQLVTLSSDGASLSFGWPQRLPAPDLNGSQATYAEVLPGVDLKLTATSGGFTQVLVVKDAEAAANPDLEHLELSVQGEGVQVRPGLDGGLTAVDANGAKVFEGPAGQMWDSAGDDHGAVSQTSEQAAKAASTPSSASFAIASDEPAGDGGPTDGAAGPGPGDNSAPVETTVDATKVSLTPDLGLLRGPDTVYPVFIDPPVGKLTRADWTALSSDGDRFWEFKGDKGVGYCANYAGYLCSSTPYTQRMYFEYPLTSLYGKQVLDATFEAYQTWTFTCDPHFYDLHLVDKNISSSTSWSTRPTELDLMGDRTVSYGRGDLCSPSQPANWVKFSDNVDEETNENLTPTIRSYVEGQKSQITLSLTAHDEGTTAAWARFRDDAVLSVTYISKPGLPDPAGVQQGTTGSVCNPATTPFATSDTTPKMYATVQSADGGNAQLRASFEVWKADGSTKMWSALSPTSDWVADNSKRDATTTALAPQTDYRMRAKTQAYYITDRGTTGILDSSWSSWCYFRVDTDSPPPVVVTSKDGKYKPADTDPASGGVGESGEFTFTPGDTDPNTAGIQSDVTSYKWRLNSGVISAPITVAKGAPLNRTITPDQPGENTLQVWGYDAAGNASLTGYYSFNVKGAEQAAGIWHLDGNGNDSTTAPTPHALTPTSDATYSPLSRGGTHALKLNGTSTSYASTSSSVLDTSKSFTVSAWVWMQDNTASYTALAQAGTNASGFVLYYSQPSNEWIFNRHGTDVPSPVITRSSSTKPPVVKAWTHLAGVYNAAAGTIQLFVNGHPQGSPVPFTTPWNATGSLQVGRHRNNAAWGGFFNGTIDEVHVWSRALADTEVMNDAALYDEDAGDETAKAPMTAIQGNWDATTATGTSIIDASGYSRPMTLTGATLDIDPDTINNPDSGLPTRQVMTLNGSNNYATVTGPLVDDAGSFTATAWVRLDSSKYTDTTKSYKTQVLGQSGTTQSSWGVWYEQPAGSPVGKWKFGRPDKDATGATWTTADSEIAALDTWVRLTVVYDAQGVDDDTSQAPKYGAMYLYVDTSEVSGDRGVSYTAPWQGGGLFEVGRSKTDGAPARYFPGHIANVRVWAGAMSTSTIWELYAAEQS